MSPRRAARTLVLFGVMLAAPLGALADGPGSGEPSQEPTKPAPTPIDKAPAEKHAPAEKQAPAKNKPVDKPAGQGSGAGSASPPPAQHKPVTSPVRHA